MTEAELLARIAQAEREGWTELDLEGERIERLPPEIGRLTGLRRLRVGGELFNPNPLQTLPAEIGQLVNLTELDLSHNQLTAVPPEIGQLLNLTQLDLRGNQLTAVPSEIGQLVNLTTLDLRGSISSSGVFNGKLTAVPTEIVQLINLTTLSLTGNQLTAVPTEIVQLINLTTLDLRYNKLTAMPPEIGQLGNLTTLNLGGNQLTAVPPEIGQLPNLTWLSLSSNQLTAVPPEIGQLVNLTQLGLGSNQLTAVPLEILQLVNLTQLDLSFNELTAVPLEVLQLVNLTQLDLSFNLLTTIPPEIGQLVNLSKLFLFENQLTTVPPEIGQLLNLTLLHLSSNRLKAMPPEIWQLRNLTVLSLGGNQLTVVSPEIGQLLNLTELILGDNQLTAVPPEIWQLVNLTRLDLGENQLTAVPPEIGQLVNLTRLDLGENQLEFLPTALTRLPHLKELNLYGNSLPLPTELIGGDRWSAKTDPQPILEAYFQQCAPLHQLKLLLLGEGEVGKTSLVERLLHDQPPSDSGKTIGLDIHPWTISIPEPINVNIWDFGGQEIYHATHQFFLSHRSLYLLLIDARQDDEANRLAYWLQLIQSFGGDSPIILVVNKIDQGPRRVAERELQAQYPQLRHIIYTSCTTGEGLNGLRHALTQTISTLPHIHDQIPQTWLAVKERLATLTADYISYEEFTALCQEEGIQQSATQDIIARLLHDLGSALNYGDESSLAGTYILQPDWVTYGIYQIVNAPHLQAHGLLHPDDLKRIFHNQPRYPFRKHHILLDMMVKFELCPREALSDGRRLIPTLLHPDRPVFEWPTNDPPRFQLRYKVLPPSVLARLMVRLHRHLWQEARWRDGFVLSRNGARARVQALRDQNQIHIWLDGDADARRTLLTLIRTQLEEIHASFARLEVEEWVPLPASPSQAIKYEALLRLLERGLTTHYDPNSDVQFEVMPLLDSLETPVDRLERRLYRALSQRFNLGELHTLVSMDLGLDGDNFPKEKEGFIRELILKCQRTGLLGRLEQFSKGRG